MTAFTDSALQEINLRTQSYLDAFIDVSRSKTITESSIDPSTLPSFQNKRVGKVRDIYTCESFVVMVTTDRQSAFDRRLASVPFKGQVLNMTSLWWFELTSKELKIPNHVIGSPHPNVTIGKRCTIFPIEFVMRGYITGTTSTSIWMNYKNGMRNYCGHALPEGMVKNQMLDCIKLTPTTKDDLHDELISAEEVVSSGRMSQSDWDTCAAYAHQLFAFSQQRALENGLILVDTKYEFGKDSEGNILLVDEIQTPDSSRYWIAHSYEERMAAGQEPENIDKEFLRKWFTSHCDPYKDEVLPEAPPELVNELSRRYIMIYEILTRKTFQSDDCCQQNQQERGSIGDAVADFVSKMS